MRRLLGVFFIIVMLIYAFSGLLKWAFPFGDPTLIFGLLGLVAIPFSLNEKIIHFKNKTNNIIVLILVLHLLIFGTIFYTISERYYVVKSGKMMFNLIGLFLPIIILRSQQSFAIFRRICWLLLVIAVSLLFRELIENNLERIRYFQEREVQGVSLPDYMSISYFLGSMILLLNDTKSKIGLFLLFITLVFMILLAAKGPLLFLIVCLLAQNRQKIKIFSIKSFVYIIGFVLMVSFFSILTGRSVFTNIEGRLMFFSDGIEADDSSYERIILFNKSIEVIQDNFFFGVGIGGFSKAISSEDARLSPHNIFLELWSETGILPVMILSIIFIVGFVEYNKSIKKFPTSSSKSIVAICLYMTLGLLVSSYLEDLRLTYFWIGVSVAFFTVKFQENNQYVRN